MEKKYYVTYSYNRSDNNAPYRGCEVVNVISDEDGLTEKTIDEVTKYLQVTYSARPTSMMIDFIFPLIG